MSKKVVIIGGVAGGMSCAARVKRLDERAEITVFERGPDVSFANCGMPYYIGGVITDRANMLVQTAGSLKNRYGLDVRVRHEVTRIDRAAKKVYARQIDTGDEFETPYDALVLAPGASPIRPPIPGADLPHVHVLNNLANMDAIAAAAQSASSACVVGAGFIGLELAENLRARGLRVSVVEMMEQVLPPLDAEMCKPLEQELKLHGVNLQLKETVTAIESTQVQLASGKALPADLVCLCVGVRPNMELARDAGLELGERGHIRVDVQMRTSDPDVYAVGDAVEVWEFATGERAAVPLAGPANRQGRIAADVICGRTSAYRDTQGTAIVKVFNLAAAITGLNERRLKKLGLPYRRLFLHPMQRPKYYPGAQPIGIKLLFSPEGRIYGAQAVGMDGVEPIINTLATALRSGMTVQDLEHLELAYSPQWGGAKHGINMLGFSAVNILNGDVELIEPDEPAENVQWLDVRTEAEADGSLIPGAILIPVDELRTRLSEVPRDKEIAVYCAVGLRGYIAYRLLKQRGYKVRNLNGGYRTWTWFHTFRLSEPQKDCRVETKATATPPPAAKTVQIGLDCSGMQCPGPLVKVKEALTELGPGQMLEITATDPGFAADIPAWCKATGNTLVDVSAEKGRYIARVVKGVNTTAVATATAASATAQKKTIICFSNDLDRVLATFIIANGAAAMGNEVTIFFTFWGLNVLRKERTGPVKKGLLDAMFGMMMPKGPKRLKLSKMNMAGMGTAMMKHVMRTKNVMPLDELIQTARDNGVRLIACAMSMDVMGIKQEELIDGIEIAGVGAYLGNANEANVNLFI